MINFLKSILHEQPFIFFIMWCGVYYIVKCVFFYLPKRYLRHKDIQKHGWPIANHMDADGDIIFPEK